MSFQSRSVKRPPSIFGAPRNRVRPRVEQLEDRCVPAAVSLLGFTDANDLVLPARYSGSGSDSVVFVNANTMAESAGLLQLNLNHGSVYGSEQTRYAHPKGAFAGWTDASDRSFFGQLAPGGAGKLIQFNRPAVSGTPLSGDLIRVVDIATGNVNDVVRASDTAAWWTVGQLLQQFMDPEDVVLVGHFRQTTYLEALFFNRTTHGIWNESFRVLNLVTGEFSFVGYHDGGTFAGWLDNSHDVFLTDYNHDGYDDLTIVKRVANPQDYRGTATPFIGVVSFAGVTSATFSDFSQTYSWNANGGAFYGFDDLNDQASGGTMTIGGGPKGVILLANSSSSGGAAFAIMQPTGGSFSYVGGANHNSVNAGSFNADDVIFLADFTGDDSDEVVSFSRAANQTHVKVFNTYPGNELGRITPTTPYVNTGNRWLHPELITLSFTPDGTDLRIFANGQWQTSNLVNKFDGAWSTWVWQTALLRAAQTWAQYTNINFTVVSDNGDDFGSGAYQQGGSGFGDIRFAAYNDSSTGWLGRARYPQDANNTSSAGDIVFNSLLSWSLPGTAPYGGYDLFSVAMHEIGHALGLGHGTTSAAVMYATYNGATGLHTDDIAGIRAIYSGGNPRSPDAFEGANGNGWFTTASNLTPYLGSGLTALATGLDITTTSDWDFYSVTVPTGTSGTMQVRLQSAGLSLLTPWIGIYDANWGYVTSTGGWWQYTGNTLNLTVNGVQAGEVYYFLVAGVDDSAFSIGAYALALNFGTGTTPTASSPNTQTANGSPPRSTGWVNQEPEQVQQVRPEAVRQQLPARQVDSGIAAVLASKTTRLTAGNHRLVLVSESNHLAAEPAVASAGLSPSASTNLGMAFPETSAAPAVRETEVVTEAVVEESTDSIIEDIIPGASSAEGAVERESPDASEAPSTAVVDAVFASILAEDGLAASIKVDDATEGETQRFTLATLVAATIAGVGGFQLFHRRERERPEC